MPLQSHKIICAYKTPFCKFGHIYYVWGITCKTKFNNLNYLDNLVHNLFLIGCDREYWSTYNTTSSDYIRGYLCICSKDIIATYVSMYTYINIPVSSVIYVIASQHCITVYASMGDKQNSSLYFSGYITKKDAMLASLSCINQLPTYLSFCAYYAGDVCMTYLLKVCNYTVLIVAMHTLFNVKSFNKYMRSL